MLSRRHHTLPHKITTDLHPSATYLVEEAPQSPQLSPHLPTLSGPGCWLSWEPSFAGFLCLGLGQSQDCLTDCSASCLPVCQCSGTCSFAPQWLNAWTPPPCANMAPFHDSQGSFSCRQAFTAPTGPSTSHWILPLPWEAATIGPNLQMGKLRPRKGGVNSRFWTSSLKSFRPTSQNRSKPPSFPESLPPASGVSTCASSVCSVPQRRL